MRELLTELVAIIGHKCIAVITFMGKIFHLCIWCWFLLKYIFVRSIMSLFQMLKQLSAMIIVILSKSLVYCYYAVCN